MPVGRQRTQKIGSNLKVTCPECDGTGYLVSGSPDKCLECRGTGYVQAMVVKPE